MELDELKKSWNKFNEHLEQKELLDNQTLEKLMNEHKQNTDGKINKMASWGKFSLIIAGAGILILILLSLFVIPLTSLSNQTTNRIYFAGGFLCLLFLVGGWWDFKSYLWLKKTNIEILPVVKVIERINRFRQWMKYEIAGLTVTLIALTGVIYYIFEICKRSTTIQIIFIVFCVSAISIITYLLFKKMIFDNLHEIKKNLDELRELNND